MSVYHIYPQEKQTPPTSRAQRRKLAKTPRIDRPWSPSPDADLSDDWSILSSMFKASRQSDLTLSDIVWQLEKEKLRTVSIEPIFRLDRWQRFEEKVRKLRETFQCPYSPSAGQIDIVFHGTASENNASIVENGFLLPQKEGEEDDESGHESEHGQWWGAGIYFTRFVELAADYGNWENIIVCAVIMGRNYRFTSWKRKGRRDTILKRGYHSHVNPNRHEGCVFDVDQIVPLVVLRLQDLCTGMRRVSFERADEEDLEEMKSQEGYRYQRNRGQWDKFCGGSLLEQGMLCN